MAADDVAALTDRERDVLRSLAEGRSTRQVATALGLTVETVRSYTKSIYATLDVHNRAEATLAAIDAGLLERGTGAVGATPSRGSGSGIAAPVRPVVGRDAERDVLRDLLAVERLVTVVGMGGAGKTVLARVSARDHVAATGERGAIALLEHAEDDVGLASGIAGALGVRLRGRDDAWRELTRVAGDEPTLLVLDNLDHLLGHADRLLGLLTDLPALRLLVTSRRPMGVAEETVLRIRGLAVPTDRRDPPVGYGAVDLFVAEVARLDPHRRLGPDDLDVVGDICRLLDGWPLAVVLAAGWTDALSLEDIATEVATGPDLLTSDALLPERHRSLTGLVDASIGRRPLPEQQVLARLSVFEGGFDLEASSVVASGSRPRLASLIRASLVRHDPSRDRYDLHPVVRARAAALLGRTSHGDDARDAHADHYAAHAAAWADAMAGRPDPPGQREAVRALSRERDNLRAAWAHAAATGRTAALTAMLPAVTTWLDHLSELAECERLLTVAIESSVDEVVRARMLLHREYVRLQSGSIDPATSPADDALARLVDAGDGWVPAAEVIVAFLEVSVLGRPAVALERATRLAAEDSPAPPYWRHRAQLLLGFVLAATGDGQAAVRVHLAGMHDARRAGDHSAEHVLLVLATLGLVRAHRLDDVPAMLDQATTLQSRLPNAQTEASVRLIRLILAVLAGEEVERAARDLDDPDARRILRENQHMANLRDGVIGLARGAAGDAVGAHGMRDAQDDRVAAGMLGESVLWAEVGVALADLAHGDVEAARRRAEAARPWERAAGLAASEVDVLLDVIDAVAAHRAGDIEVAEALVDRALSAPSLLTTVLRDSAAIRRITT